MRYFPGDVVELVIFSGNPAERIMIVNKGRDSSNSWSYYQYIRFPEYDNKLIVDKIDVDKVEDKSTTYIGTIDFSLMCKNQEKRKKIFLDMINSINTEITMSSDRLSVYRDIVASIQKEGWE